MEALSLAAMWEIVRLLPSDDIVSFAHTHRRGWQCVRTQCERIRLRDRAHTDADVSRLHAFVNLRELDARDADIDYSGAYIIACLPSLRKLVGSDANMVASDRMYPDLECLDLRTVSTPFSFARIAERLPHLKELRCARNGALTTNDAAEIARLPRLRVLDVYVDGDDVDAVNVPERTTDVTVAFDHPTIRTIEKLASLRWLRRLCVSSNHALDDEAARHFGALTHLEELSFGQETLTPAAAAACASLKRLRVLNVSDNELTDASLCSIGSIESLEVLKMSDCVDASNDIRPLAKLRRLRELDIGNVFRESEEYDGESEMLIERHFIGYSVLSTVFPPMTALTSLNLCRSDLESESGAWFAALPALHTLCVADNMSLNDTFAMLLCASSSIRSLDVCETSVADAGLVCLSTLCTLEELKAVRCTLSDAGLKRMRSARRLRAIDVSNPRQYMTSPPNGITDDGVTAIASLPKMECITCLYTRVTVECADNLRKRGVFVRRSAPALHTPSDSEYGFSASSASEDSQVEPAEWDMDDAETPVGEHLPPSHL